MISHVHSQAMTRTQEIRTLHHYHHRHNHYHHGYILTPINCGFPKRRTEANFGGRCISNARIFSIRLSYFMCSGAVVPEEINLILKFEDPYKTTPRSNIMSFPVSQSQCKSGTSLLTISVESPECIKVAYICSNTIIIKRFTKG